MKRTKHIDIRTTEDIQAKINTAAKLRGISATELIESAVLRFLESDSRSYENTVALIDAASKYITSLEAIRDYERELTEAETKLLAAFWVCYEILARTSILLDNELSYLPNPTEMREPGEPDKVYKFISSTDNEFKRMLDSL